MDKETQTEMALLDYSLKLYQASEKDDTTPENKQMHNAQQNNNKAEPGDSNSEFCLNDKATQTDDYDDEENSPGGETDPQKSEVANVLTEVALFAVKAVAISGGVLGGIALALPVIGFGAGGIVAGSLAALYQSTFLGGTIASGSVFAVLQSVGAAGLAASTNAAVVAGSVAATGVHTILKKTNARNDDADGSDCPSDGNSGDNKHGGDGKKGN